VEFPVATLEQMAEVFLCSTEVKLNSSPDPGTLAIAA